MVRRDKMIRRDSQSNMRKALYLDLLSAAAFSTAAQGGSSSTSAFVSPVTRRMRRISDRPLPSRLFGRRFTSEKDLFEDESYYGGKLYGRTTARRNRGVDTTTITKEDLPVLDEEDAWEQYYGVSENDDETFSVRADDAFNAIRDYAYSNIAAQTSDVAKELDAEKTERQQHYQSLLRDAVNLVSYNLVERSEEARLVVLAMVANEHVLLLGAPGTGKSEIGRRLSQICGGEFFQRLLTRFTTTEELFGPLSLSALEKDEYKRITEGYLTTASVAFLDEIFKANSAILNTLLTVLNERKFDNGGVRDDCAIRCVVGASNELPEDEELDALYDRFLIRKEVKPVSDDGLGRLLSMPSLEGSKSDQPKIVASDFDCMAADLADIASTITMPDDVCTILRNMRIYLRDELACEVSDRRLVQSARLLRLSAASNGRRSIDPIDLLLMQHVVWRVPEQRAVVRQWLWDNLTPGGEGSSADIIQYRFLLDGLKETTEGVIRKTGGDVAGDAGARNSDLVTIAALREEVANLAAIIQRRFESLSRHRELLYRAPEHCWLSDNEALAAKQLLLPKAERAIEETKKVVLECRILEQLLTKPDDSPITVENDLRLSIVGRLLESKHEYKRIFSEGELQLSSKSAKRKYDTDTFRSWKRAKRKGSQ